MKMKENMGHISAPVHEDVIMSELQNEVDELLL